jgi:5-methylthioribose kinase
LTDLATILLDSGQVTARARMCRLTGGVSSDVLAVADGSDSWVAKSPLGRMAVAEYWPADPSRSAREAAALRLLDGRLGPVRVPRLRFEAPAERVIGMEMMSGEPWKALLLRGEVEPDVAAALGRAMSRLHALTAEGALAGGEELFEQLRVDPYYRTTARRVPTLAAALGALISASAAAGRVLVHGDFNPKNVLVGDGPPVLVDWEIAHAGDPAFDLGMLSAHLLLKACRRSAAIGPYGAALAALWDAYDGPADGGLARRHAGAIMAARLHGKSPVDYLHAPEERAAAMDVAVALLVEPRPGVSLAGHLDDAVGLIVELEPEGVRHRGVHDVKRDDVGEAEDFLV